MRSQAEETPWAVHACAEADLGDLRRTTRLVALAHVLAQPPTAARPAACGNDARRKAADRFVAHDAITPHDSLASPSEATYRRLAKVPLLLAVQDPTAVDWTGPPAPTGVGPLGHTACQGRHVPSTVAFTPARLPVGRWAPHVGARHPAAIGTRKRRQPWPMGQQESPQGLTSRAAVRRAHAWGPQPRFGSLGAREAEV